MSSEANYKRINFEITNNCNMNCSFCPDRIRPIESISLQDFERIIIDCSPLTEKFSLHLMGEPFTHPNFKELLEIGSKHNSPFEITTNGILLSKYKDLLLKDNSVRQINFSIQGFLDNYPDSDITNYMNELFSFVLEAEKQKPELYINFRLWNLTSSDNTKNESLITLIEKGLQTTINRNVETGGIKFKKIRNRIYLHFDTVFNWPALEDQKIGDTGSCYGLRNHFGILSDGTVVPCCLDKDGVINLGNCLERPINEILNSKKALTIKKGFEQGVLEEELCKHCSFIKRFKKN